MTSTLWTPSPERVDGAQLTDFARRYAPGVAAPDYAALHAWSVEHPAEFWSAVWDYSGVIGDAGEQAVIGDGMRGTRFFPDARLNFAQNLLERGTPDAVAISFRCESGETLRWTRAELTDQVDRMAHALAAAGLEPGDRVAAMLPNRPETVAAMLATTALGGVWSSCSPDFGVAGVLDRFGQIEPRILLACTDYSYGGKRFDCRAKVEQILAQLPSVERAFILPGDNANTCADARAADWQTFTATAPGSIDYRPQPFNHPLYILFSSGTTGAPKCIVHGAGGTLLQHLKEHRLQADIRAGDRVFYFTTCGWMMWNWLVSSLASEAQLMLFDGSPFHPSGAVLLDYADEQACNFFGVSAKYIDALKTHGYSPRESHDLSSIRAIASTGSPLVPESFDYVYEQIKPDVALQSISGGTDIVSCFVLGNPWQPVQRGEIQGAGLGMAVEVWNDEGHPVAPGNKGDLVCTRPFPSMPIGFWNDPDGTRYSSAYFDTFEGIWHHGDYAEPTHSGGFIIHGRSDATLNPGGVRIGTAEIYRQVEQIPEIVEALAVGQSWDDDVRVVLFVVLREGAELSEELRADIRTRIRTGASPRHVPARIVAVPDLPRTRSGKLAELAVKHLLDGRPVKNRNALANPECLTQFENIPELQQ